MGRGLVAGYSIDAGNEISVCRLSPEASPPPCASVSALPHGFGHAPWSGGWRRRDRVLPGRWMAMPGRHGGRGGMTGGWGHGVMRPHGWHVFHVVHVFHPLHVVHLHRRVGGGPCSGCQHEAGGKEGGHGEGPKTGMGHFLFLQWARVFVNGGAALRTMSAGRR